MPQQHASVWLVRAGRDGQDEARAFSDGLVIIGFSGVGDLSAAKCLEDVLAAVEEAHPKEKHNTRVAWARQLWAFVGKIQHGDVVVLPAKTSKRRLNLGVFVGDYSYREIDGVWRHSRAVEWKQRDLARTDFAQDMLYSFGAFSTVCRITRNNAEARIGTVLMGGIDPGFEDQTAGTPQHDEPEDSVFDQSLDIAQAAHDEIVTKVRRALPDRQFARLVGGYRGSCSSAVATVTQSLTLTTVIEQ